MGPVPIYGGGLAYYTMLSAPNFFLFDILTAEKGETEREQT